MQNFEAAKLNGFTVYSPFWTSSSFYIIIVLSLQLTTLHLEALHLTGKSLENFLFTLAFAFFFWDSVWCEYTFNQKYFGFGTGNS